MELKMYVKMYRLRFSSQKNVTFQQIWIIPVVASFWGFNLKWDEDKSCSVTFYPSA